MIHFHITDGKMISNNTLRKIAIIGGLVTGSTGYAFYFRIQYDIKQTDTFKDTMNALRTHKKAIPYLGEPVTFGRIKYGDGQQLESATNINYKWFTIPLTGTNTKGKLYYEVTLNKKNSPFVSKIEITFDNIPGKTFVIRDNEIN